jgi:hypothetical protein
VQVINGANNCFLFNRQQGAEFRQHSANNGDLAATND